MEIWNAKQKGSSTEFSMLVDIVDNIDITHRGW
jgi:hypothetical protein